MLGLGDLSGLFDEVCVGAGSNVLHETSVRLCSGENHFVVLGGLLVPTFVFNR